MSILFSPIGESDPIRNNYDGPMLHILRNYSDIDVCYLFLTDKMKKNYDNKLYDLAIKDLENRLNRKIECNYIITEIKEANNFDIFYSPFIDNLKQIRTKYQNDTIYLNLSSGTPQMGTTLALISCSSNITNLVALQVSRPSEDVKRGTSSVEKEYDLEFETYFNYDNNLNINRCKKVESIMIINNNVLERVETLIKSYNYDIAYEIYKNSPLYNQNVAHLIMHLKYREKLDIDKAKEVVKNSPYKGRLFLKYLDKNFKKNRILEYFLLLKNLYFSNKTNDFIVRLCSYCEELQKEIIFHLFKYNVESKFCEKNNDKYILSEFLIKDYSKELYNLIQNRFNQNYKSNLLNIEVLNVIINYELEHKKIDHSNLYEKTLTKIEKLKKYRNISAHRLEIVTKNNLNEECDIEQLLKSIKDILADIYPDLNKKYFLLYYDINKLIIEEMR